MARLAPGILDARALRPTGATAPSMIGANLFVGGLAISIMAQGGGEIIANVGYGALFAAATAGWLIAPLTLPRHSGSRACFARPSPVDGKPKQLDVSSPSAC